MRQLDSIEDAEDLAGEICVHCMQSRHQFRGDAEFSTWLRRVAINVLRDFIRSRRAARTASSPNDVGRIPAEIRSASEDWPGSYIQAESLIMAMNRLTPRQRHLIEWKYGDHLTYQEIATRLNTSPTAVSQALRRARLSLKQAIEETI